MEPWLSAWGSMLERHDMATARHCERVEQLAVAFATTLALADDDRTIVGLAARFHDVGKIHVPRAILQKAGPLDPAEREVMKRHSVRGEHMVRTARRLPFQYEVAQAVRHHHEHYDGTGYPDGLQGQAIPLASRLVAVVDAYDAMRSRRPYRVPHAHKDVMRVLQGERGSTYDPPPS